MIISCSNIKKSFIDQTILKNVSFHIENHEKAALIGNNGAGKTTLFKILTKDMDPDEGTVSYSKDCTIGYLKQHMELNSKRTVYEELLHVFDEVIGIEKRLHEMEEEIARTASTELINSYDKLRVEFEDKKGYEYKSLVKGVLKGLGFDESVYDKPISILSGGQKNRVALGKLLLQEPTLLLLDEPTNYLDIISMKSLEDALKNTEKTIIVVSHDKHFIENVCDYFLEIKDKKIIQFSGSYDNYIEEKNKEKLSEKDQKNSNEMLLLENRLSNLISMICMETDKELKKKYEKEFDEISDKLKKLR